MNQHALAFTQGRALEEIGPDREECLGDCGRVEAVEPGWNRKALRLGNGAVLRVPAARHERADAIARLPTPDLRADALNRSRHLESRHVRGAGGRRVSPEALHDVGPIDAGRLYTDEDVGWSDIR